MGGLCILLFMTDRRSRSVIRDFPFPFPHQDCGAVALLEVPGHGDVEVEAVLAHRRVRVPQLLTIEAGPRLEGHLHARVGLPLRVTDAGPSVIKRSWSSINDIHKFNFSVFYHPLVRVWNYIKFTHSPLLCRVRRSFMDGP